MKKLVLIVIFIFLNRFNFLRSNTRRGHLQEEIDEAVEKAAGDNPLADYVADYVEDFLGR